MEKLTGHGRPSSHLIGEVNQHYEDLDTGDIYECRVASQYSPLHGAPVGGYQWELRFKGEDILDSAQYLSGGASSWNDLKDKPFYDESPVLYEGYPEYAFFSAKLSDVHLRAGVEYIVAYERDGVQVCSYFTAQEDNGNVTIDNTDDIGGNGFVLTYNPDDDCTYFMPKSGVFMEGCPEFDDMGAYAYTSTVKLHISYMHSEDAGVKTIDPKYLPNVGMSTFVLNTRNEDGDESFSVKDEDRNAVIEAVKRQEQFRFIAKDDISDEYWGQFYAAAFVANYCVEYDKDLLCGDPARQYIRFAEFDASEGKSIRVMKIDLAEEEVESIKSAWGLV